MEAFTKITIRILSYSFSAVAATKVQAPGACVVWARLQEEFRLVCCWTDLASLGTDFVSQSLQGLPESQGQRSVNSSSTSRTGCHWSGQYMSVLIRQYSVCAPGGHLICSYIETCQKIVKNISCNHWFKFLCLCFFCSLN